MLENLTEEKNELRADVLVISAHPDDAEFAAAGTVACWTGEGKVVVYVVCSNGEKGTSDRQLNPEVLAGMRRKEQEAAAGHLGVSRVVFLNLPDQGLEDTPEFRKKIVRQIRIFRPHTVVTSDPYRRYIWHRDHRVVGKVTLDAVYPYARDHLAYPDLLEEGIEPHKVKEVLLWGAEEINYRSDITGAMGRKLEALRLHESQVREHEMQDLTDMVMRMSRDMASGEDFEFGEAFYHVVIP
jgi:LmbE family N-acetylglucosaminyl deacetylase